MKPFAVVKCDNNPDRPEYKVVFDEVIFGQGLGTSNMDAVSAERMANHYNKIYRARVRGELQKLRDECIEKLKDEHVDAEAAKDATSPPASAPCFSYGVSGQGHIFSGTSSLCERKRFNS